MRAIDRRFEFCSRFRSLGAFCALLCLSTLCGCQTLLIHTSCPTRTIDVEPACTSPLGQACEDHNTLKQGRKSLKTLEECRGKKYSNHFEEGFLRAFYDLSHGQSGVLPPVPPARYWDKKYRCPSGAIYVKKWYAGYKTGVCQAHLCGVSQCAKVRSREDYLSCQQCCPTCPVGGGSVRVYHSTKVYPSQPLNSTNQNSSPMPIPALEQETTLPDAPLAPVETEADTVKELPSKSTKQPMEPKQAQPEAVKPVAPPVPQNQSSLLGTGTDLTELESFFEEEPEPNLQETKSFRFGHSFNQFEQNSSALQVPAVPVPNVPQASKTTDFGFGHTF